MSVIARRNDEAIQARVRTCTALGAVHNSRWIASLADSFAMTRGVRHREEERRSDPSTGSHMHCTRGRSQQPLDRFTRRLVRDDGSAITPTEVERVAMLPTGIVFSADHTIFCCVHRAAQHHRTPRVRTVTKSCGSRALQRASKSFSPYCRALPALLTGCEEKGLARITNVSLPRQQPLTERC